MLILAAAISGSSQKGQELQDQADRKEALHLKAAAYSDYLLRTGKIPGISAMSERERTEFVLDAVRSFNKKHINLAKGTAFFGGASLSELRWSAGQTGP